MLFKENLTYTNHMHHVQKVVYVLPVLSLAALLAIFFMTDPLSAGPGGMLAVFFLVYVLFASTFFIILHGGLRVITTAVNRYRTVNLRKWQIGVRKSYYVASVLAFGPVLLLAMQSVGQLQLRDVILMIVFLMIAIFYVIKRS